MNILGLDIGYSNLKLAYGRSGVKIKRREKCIMVYN